MKTFKIKYQQTYTGYVTVKAKDARTAKTKAIHAIEGNGDVEIISNDVVIISLPEEAS